MRVPGWMARTLDVLIAAGLLLAALPAFVVISALVGATSRGPVFFRHPRVGLNGRRFSVVKFRTLRHGDDGLAALPGSYKVTLDSPAVTAVGRFLRRSGLDELPQLINVVLGDMALIGIRPMVERELAAEPEEFREIYVRFRPGLSGLWQVEGRTEHLEHTGRTHHDLQWARERTLLGDIALMLRTPWAMLRGYSASTAGHAAEPAAVSHQ